MSTRANIIVKDSYQRIYFYRHSDGYPEGVQETLGKFLNWMREGRIRKDAMQASGWLIIIGHEEYSTEYGIDNKPLDWKVGAYEPTSKLQGDVDFIYVIDIEKMSIMYTKYTGVDSIEEIPESEWIKWKDI